MARLYSNNVANYLSRTAPVTGVPLSIAARFRNLDSSVTRAIVNLQQAGTANAFTLNWRSAGFVAAITNDGITIGRSQIAAPAMNTFNHAVAVFPGTASRFIYLNGSAGVEDTTDITPAEINTLYVGVGNSDVGFEQAWSGDIVDLAIWNAVVSSTEAADLARGIPAPQVKPANLIGYWPMRPDVSLTTSEQDQSGNGNHLGITGSVPLIASNPFAEEGRFQQLNLNAFPKTPLRRTR